MGSYKAGSGLVVAFVLLGVRLWGLYGFGLGSVDGRCFTWRRSVILG